MQKYDEIMQVKSLPYNQCAYRLPTSVRNRKKRNALSFKLLAQLYDNFFFLERDVKDKILLSQQ